LEAKDYWWDMSKTAAAIIAIGFVIGCFLLAQGMSVSRYTMLDDTDGVGMFDSRDGRVFLWNTNLNTWSKFPAP
jgi:hypothetical protein